ncbi:LysR family transcriptional regulator [Agrobacterium tumefaciens]|nr:LysR family transcriptional regulator [Agrobacterium tumefaciens]
MTLVQTASNVQHNLRHLRVFLAVADTNSVTRAAALCYLSQPAVTQALSKIERILKTPLFERTAQGLFPNTEGQVLERRVRRAFDFLDPALTELSPRLKLIATTSQLEALIAVKEAGNFTLAARRLGLAQPTVHRAVTQLEAEAAKPLFERTSYGIIATKQAVSIAEAARLAFAELIQAEVDLAETRSEEVGKIVVGALPLSRSYLLPRAIAEFRNWRRKITIQIVDGPYAELLAGLRRGEIDFLIGALRDPLPIADVKQTFLFSDTIVIVAGKSHPILRDMPVRADRLVEYPWIVGLPGTPIRTQFDRMFERWNCRPDSIVESASLILMRELLLTTDHLGCISYRQAQAELSRGLISSISLDLEQTARPIGLTTRANWVPTAPQRQFLEIVDKYSKADME